MGGVLQAVKKAPVETPVLFQLTLIPGCNTPADVTLAQMRANVERDLPWLEMEDAKTRPLVIVAGGPSLKRYWPMIRAHDGDIMALNNAYGFLLDHGLMPKYFMLLDARADNLAFLDGLACHGVRHYITAQAHPCVFDYLQGRGLDTRLFLTTHPESLEITQHIDKPKHRLAGPVGTVGMKALALAYALGYKELHLYGYDSSYEDGEHHAFKQVLNDTSKTIDIYLDGKKYTTTPTMSHQVSEFVVLATGMARMGITIDLHCDGLLPDMVKQCNTEGERPLADREREKYEQMWAMDDYRKTAPGYDHAALAVLLLGAKWADTIIDFGCGSGAGAQRLKRMGYTVTGVDFAENCRNADCDFDFVQACLWDMPQMYAMFGYCTDVMEHIPTEMVERVLAGIASRCDAVYFNISTCADSFGSRIGKKLHMTVMSGENWKIVLDRYWESVLMTEHEFDVQFVCKQPKRTMP